MSIKKVVRRSQQEMLQINVRQKDFYESHFDATQSDIHHRERAANLLTNIWARIRDSLIEMRSVLGISEQICDLHRLWLRDVSSQRVLDLGCFSGNPLSLWIAEHSAEYIGIDLSEQAIALLNEQLQALQLHHAHAYAEDFLANSYPDNYFDVVYAQAVLHHFKDMTVILDELYRVLKPGGIIISFDPLMTEPLNRCLRLLYRPFQSDRDWEWPFTRKTIRQLQNYFQIQAMQGFMGMAKLGFPFQLIPGLFALGVTLGKWGNKYDTVHTQKMGLSFFLCWQMTLCLRKVADEQ
jgi:ubiquinone/menaquinone biosynthesis C-methylase UbiE